MKKRHNIIIDSWKLVKENKILFLPNILLFIIHIFFIVILAKISGISNMVLENNYLGLKEVIFSAKTLIFLLVYTLVLLFVDNYFLAAKYGMIKDLIVKKKTNIHNAIRFANKHYLVTIKIHILSYLIIFIPLILLFVLLFLFIPTNPFIAIGLFLPLMMVYFVYISIRLLFVYPIMTFENKGAYQSLVKDFHFVKTHAHHTFMTWLIVLVIVMVTGIAKENFLKVTSFIYQQIAFLGFLLILLILLVEFTVSVWEHVFIFKSYLAGKKIKKKK
jgi:hypothetical protein